MDSIKYTFERKLKDLSKWKAPVDKQDYEEIDAKLKLAKLIKSSEETPSLVFTFDHFIGKTFDLTDDKNRIAYEYVIGTKLNELNNPIFIRTVGLIPCFTSMENIENGEFLRCLMINDIKDPIHQDIVLTEPFDGIGLDAYVNQNIKSHRNNIDEYMNRKTLTERKSEIRKDIRNVTIKLTQKIISIMTYIINNLSKIEFTHYDLHLGNILISLHDEIAIIDFGTSYISGYPKDYQTSALITTQALILGANPNVYDPYFDMIYMILDFIELIKENLIIEFLNVDIEKEFDDLIRKLKPPYRLLIGGYQASKKFLRSTFKIEPYLKT